jgi:Xaa-Pro aminopeptidase
LTKHEAEDASAYNYSMLKGDMIFSVESDIYLEREFGISIEHIVLFIYDDARISTVYANELAIDNKKYSAKLE